MKAAGSIANATTSILSGTRINLFLKLNTCQIQLTSARQRISYRTSSRFSRTSIYTIFRGSRATELIFGSGSRIVRTTVWIACIDCRKSTVAFAQACAVCSPFSSGYERSDRCPETRLERVWHRHSSLVDGEESGGSKGLGADSAAMGSRADYSLCALFSNPSRLTPKVQVLLDFLDEYLGTDRDPRLNNDVAAGYFSDRSLTPRQHCFRHHFGPLLSKTTPILRKPRQASTNSAFTMPLQENCATCRHASANTP